MRIAIAASLLILAACQTGKASHMTTDADLHAFMTAYTLAWNKHDAPIIAQKFYRMGPDVAAQMAATKKTFDDLVAQGYDKSDIHEIKACVLGPDTGWAGMKFSRLKTDGAPLPPKDRASQYDLRKFPDGWRITKLTGYDATKPLECPKAG